MKLSILKCVFACCVFFCSTNIQAQKKEAYEIMVENVKVIVQPSTNEIVEIQTVFRGGVQNYGADKAGIEALALKALTECGTQNDDKNSFKNKLDKVNAQMYSYADMDFSYLTLNCIKSDFEKVWPLYADALTKPRFDAGEFKRIQDETLNTLRERNSQPDYAIDKLAKETAFAGKNYAKEPMGSDASVKKLTAEEVKNYYKNFAVRSRIFIVVVGNVDQAALEQKISGLLNALPAGKPFVNRSDRFLPKANTIKVQKKELATNYIEALVSAPAPASKEYDAFQLAMQIFYDRHFLEVRTNNGLSYAPYSYFAGGLTPFAGIGVSTTEPDKYIAVLNNLVSKTKKGFTEEEVRNMKTRYITGVYSRQETNGEQARALASSEAVHGNWRRAITLNDDLKKVTAKDVSSAFNKYLTNYSWVYQGNPSKVNTKLYTSAAAAKLPPSKFENKKESTKVH